MLFTDWPSEVSAIFAGLSALAAAAAVYFPWRMQNSQEILRQAVLSLERAYAALSGGGMETSPPAADRMNWLTAARHIQQYQTLKSKVVVRTHRVVCEEHEEYWRHLFYQCLRGPRLPTASYYKEKSPEEPGIEPKSALIIHEFAMWPEGRVDPVDQVDVGAILARGQVLNGNYGLREYLESLPGYCAHR